MLWNMKNINLKLRERERGKNNANGPCDFTYNFELNI